MKEVLDPDYLLEFGLPPLVIAILRESEEDVHSNLTKHPHLVQQRTYGMTVLHWSCRWPTGLSILLATDAARLINEGCEDVFLRESTAVDLALHFGCDNAVALLFEAGCCWNSFNISLSTVGYSSSCVQIVARQVADRRRRLMLLAEETLTESQLSTVDRRAGVLDSNAAAITRLLQDAGIDVPTPLAVPDSYLTIYQSAKLDVLYFPIFFDHGFHDVLHRTGKHLLPIEVANLGVFAFNTQIIDEGFIVPNLFQWLETHKFLDLAPADLLPMRTNASATGRHVLAARFINESFSLGGLRYSYDSEVQVMVRTAYLDIYSCLSVDNCKCACSRRGCLPLKVGLKHATISNMWWTTNFLFDNLQGAFLLEAAKGEVVGELLRFLTFEALEMTHTCCISTHKHPLESHSPCLSRVPYLREYEGNIEEIWEEEEELHLRLENLVLEFDNQLSKSGEDLADFLRGTWRKRMAEECVPIGDDDRVTGSDSGVKFEHYCELK